MNYKVNFPEPVKPTIIVEMTKDEAKDILAAFNVRNVHTQQFASQLKAGIEDIEAAED